MKRPHVWLALVLSVFGRFSAAGEVTQPTAGPDPYLECVAVVARDSQFADIARKLPLRDLSDITFSMLADESKPTPAERQQISAWFDARETCFKASETRFRAQWPPELFALSSEGSAGVKTIGVDLYNRKITYGEANKQIEQLGNSIKSRIVPIVKQYQAEVAAQQAATARDEELRRDASTRQAAEQRAYNDSQANQAEALRLQRAQLFQNFMRANQPRPTNFNAAPGTRTTNCQTYGNSTNCVSQ